MAAAKPMPEDAPVDPPSDAQAEASKRGRAHLPGNCAACGKTCPNTDDGKPRGCPRCPTYYCSGECAARVDVTLRHFCIPNLKQAYDIVAERVALPKFKVMAEDDVMLMTLPGPIWPAPLPYYLHDVTTDLNAQALLPALEPDAQKRAMIRYVLRYTDHIRMAMRPEQGGMSPQQHEALRGATLRASKKLRGGKGGK